MAELFRSEQEVRVSGCWDGDDRERNITFWFLGSPLSLMWDLMVLSFSVLCLV